MAGGGLLTTVGVIVSMDSFGPVTDNAQGIAEMSGDVEGEAAQALTKLDAIGNTTKAITKGIAIATAVLAATALFGSFRDSVESALPAAASGTFKLDVAQPNVPDAAAGHVQFERDPKSTRLNSSHQIISYSVFFFEKKKNKTLTTR